MDDAAFTGSRHPPVSSLFVAVTVCGFFQVSEDRPVLLNTQEGNCPQRVTSETRERTFGRGIARNKRRTAMFGRTAEGYKRWLSTDCAL